MSTLPRLTELCATATARSKEQQPPLCKHYLSAATCCICNPPLVKLLHGLMPDGRGWTYREFMDVTGRKSSSATNPYYSRSESERAADVKRFREMQLARMAKARVAA